MAHMFDEGKKGAGLGEQDRKKEKDFLGGELLKIRAGGPVGAHRCRFRRREHRKGALKSPFNGNGLP